MIKTHFFTNADTSVIFRLHDHWSQKTVFRNILLIEMVRRAFYLLIYKEHPQKTRPHLFNYRPVVVKRFVVQTNDFAVITSRFKVTFLPPQKKLKNKTKFL